MVLGQVQLRVEVDLFKIGEVIPLTVPFCQQGPDELIQKKDTLFANSASVGL